MAQVLIGTLKHDGKVYGPGTALSGLPAKAKETAKAAGILAEEVKAEAKIEAAEPLYDEVSARPGGNEEE